MKRGPEDYSYIGVKDKIRLLSRALRRNRGSRLRALSNYGYHHFHFHASMTASVLPLNKLLYDFEHSDLRHLTVRSRDHMRLAIKTAGPQDFLGAAAAWREVWSRYSIKDCKRKGYCDNGACFHELHVHLLQDLTSRARFEARSNVLLATGHKLPAELADLVFEQLLVAEEIPVDSAMTTDPSSILGDLLPPFACKRFERMTYDSGGDARSLRRSLSAKDDEDDKVDEDIDEDPTEADAGVEADGGADGDASESEADSLLDRYLPAATL